MASKVCYARCQRQVAVVLDASRGKGGHQTLYFGSAFTIMRNPKDELKTGTFHNMCSQLGTKSGDLCEPKR